MLEYLLSLFAFILPAYVANSTPVIFGGGTPVDFGKNAWDGRRTLGDGKTWRGFVAGLAFGTLAGIAEYGLTGNASFIAAGFLLSYGTLCGDLAGSFMKRRLSISRGKPAFLLDQLPFLAFALFMAYPVHPVSLQDAAVLAVATYVLHAASNVAANRAGLKSVPW
jgi:CDP-2,3-bis-(O-geranylgeranyl)-sn-glycerol synthase